ncbi:MAG: TolC family protein [Acidobacteria bacterium]|nr:TolC family protein [Acidobacteriota bacterium]
MPRLCRYLIAFAAACSPLAAHAQVSLYTVVDLALRNSASIHSARADVLRAASSVSQTRDAYLPSLVFGSSLGYSYGFPVGQPSVYNVQASSLVFAISQPWYIRSARTALKAAQLSLKDSSQQIALDVSLDYIQLDEINRQIAAMDQERQYAEKLVSIEEDRLAAGVESRQELIRAELTSAQVDLKRIHLRNEAGLLQQQISHLTGLPADNILTITDSIPPMPEFASGDSLSRSSMGSNAGVESAYANAQSKEQAAGGDERQKYRPQVSFGIDYSRYAKFNNYAEYYLRFQHNNFDVGIQITLPLFDANMNDKARVSAAEAVRAKAQANLARDRANEQLFQLQEGLSELKAQQRVTQLQSDLAKEQLNSVESQLEHGSGSPNAQPLNPKDAEAARIEERQRYEDVLDADFAVARSQLSLMRAIGTIDDWWRSSAKTGAAHGAALIPK